MGQHFGLRFIGGMGRPYHQRVTTSVTVSLQMEQPFNALNEVAVGTRIADPSRTDPHESS